MIHGASISRQLRWVQCLIIFPALLAMSSTVRADALEARLAEFGSQPYLEEVTARSGEVNDHLVGLGAMKKVRGTWGLKKSARVSGHLASYTWRILDGFSADEVMQALEALYQVGPGTEAATLYSCEGRACGHGAQWASRVFGQRILYGRGDAQRYRVFSLGEDGYRLVLYGSVRSSNRQYVHAELIKLRRDEPEGSLPQASEN